MSEDGYLPKSAQPLESKRAVIRMIEDDSVVFESEELMARVPVIDLPDNVKDLVEKYRDWPGVLPGTEVEVRPVRCSHHWVMGSCWAAYSQAPSGNPPH